MRSATLFFILLSVVVSTARNLKDHHISKKHHHDREYVVCLDEDNNYVLYKTSHQGEERETSLCHNKLARARFSNKINESGWGFLDVETFDEKTPEYVQGYAAGLAEGRVTRDLIASHLYNTFDDYCGGEAAEFCNKLGPFLLKNWQWMQDQIARHSDDHYWIQVNLTLNQLVGLVQGYTGDFDRPLTAEEIVIHPLYLLNIDGDLEDLQLKFNRPEHLRKASGHCSALVKPSEDGRDLFTSHVTWTSYSTMIRMQKRYRFKLCECKYPGHSYSMSSYPGSLPSTDDFLITSARLVVTETTISNNNSALFKYITPSGVFTWIRSQVASRLAKTGKEWALVFARHNSGTYNNQWMVVDYKKFRPQKPLPKRGLLYILEQLPHVIEHDDQTSVLHTQGYWPSYNAPYFKKIFDDSNMPELVKKFGDWFSYERTPRALIFKRDQRGIKDMTGMRILMRSNNFQHDPLSRCNCTPPYSAENAISCRSDLNPKNGIYPFSSLGHRDHGATDMKLTNSSLITSLSFEAIAGPTHDPLPIFDWSNTTLDPVPRHRGQPQRWNFLPIVYQWPEDSLFS